MIGVALFAGCSDTNQESSPAHRSGIYAGLPITPRPTEDGLCWDKSQVFGPLSAWEQVKNERPMRSSGGSRVLHGVGAGDVSAGIYNNSIYEVPPDTAFEVTYHLLYLNDDEPEAEQHVRHIVLLNERQLYDAINAQDGPYYDVTLKSEDLSTLTIEVPPLKRGVNELVVLTLINPIEGDPFTLDFYGYRETLLVDEPEPVFARPYQLLPPADHDLTVWLNLSLDEIHKDWNWPETYLAVDKGSVLDYNIEAGYLSVENGAMPDLPPPETARFAIVTFLDYEQIEVMENTPVYYGEVATDTEVAQIKTQLPIPETIGRHHILVVRIDNPGVPTCLLQGPSDGYFLLFSVYGDQAAIEVQ